jgi:hypothetical protein
VPENCAETHPKLLLGSDLEGGTAHFSWALARFPAMRCKIIARNRGDCCILINAGEPKRKSRLE